MEGRGRRPSVKRKGSGLSGHFLGGGVLRDIPGFVVFRSRLGCPIQLENRVHPNLGHGLFLSGLGAVILAGANLALYEDVSALLERSGKLSELPEDDALVPFGVLNPLAILLVGGLGCEGETSEAAVAVGANFCVVAEEADELNVVLVHDGALRFVDFPYPARVTHSEASECARLPSAKLCIYGGSVADGNRNPQGDVVEAEERRAAGRRKGTEAWSREEDGKRGGRTHIGLSSAFDSTAA